ncbi:hypothetical protein ACQKMD_02960 [Viridibacillus sp. NPDC096237]
MDTDLIPANAMKNLLFEALVSSANCVDKKGGEYLMIDIILYENSE